MMSGERNAECGICLNSIGSNRPVRVIHQTKGESDHAACAECIKKWLDATNRNIICPFCREEGKIDGSVDDLPISRVTTSSMYPRCGDCRKATSTSACKNCRILMCEKCAEHHKNIHDGHYQQKLSDFTEEDKRTFVASKECDDHDQMHQLYYCRSCETPCCDRCVVEKHKKCNTVDIGSFLAEENVTEVLEKAERRVEAIKASKKSTQQAIEEACEKAHKGVEAQKKELDAEAARQIEDQTKTTKTVLTSLKDDLTEKWPKYDVDLITFRRENEEKIKQLELETDDKEETAEYGCSFVPSKDQNVVRQFLEATIKSRRSRRSLKRQITEGNEMTPEDEIRILVIGLKGSGRGKTSYAFMHPDKPRLDRGAKIWRKIIQNRKIKLVYTPGTHSLNYKGGQPREKEDIRHLLNPGPHVILFAVNEIENARVQINHLAEYRSMFVQDISNRIILVYPGKNEFVKRGVTVERFLQTRTDTMKTLLQETGRRFVAFSPSDCRNDEKELNQFKGELMDQILKIWEEHKDSPLS